VRQHPLLRAHAPSPCLTPDQIWQKYVEAFKRERTVLSAKRKDALSGETIPRKYFLRRFQSGLSPDNAMFQTTTDRATLRSDFPIVGHGRADSLIRQLINAIVDNSNVADLAMLTVADKARIKRLEPPRQPGYTSSSPSGFLADSTLMSRQTRTPEKQLLALRLYKMIPSAPRACFRTVKSAFAACPRHPELLSDTIGLRAVKSVVFRSYVWGHGPRTWMF